MRSSRADAPETAKAHHVSVLPENLTSGYFMCEEGACPLAKHFGATSSAVKSLVSGEKLETGYFWFASPDRHGDGPSHKDPASVWGGHCLPGFGGPHPRALQQPPGFRLGFASGIALCRSSPGTRGFYSRVGQSEGCHCLANTRRSPMCRAPIVSALFHRCPSCVWLAQCQIGGGIERGRPGGGRGWVVARC